MTDGDNESGLELSTAQVLAHSSRLDVVESIQNTLLIGQEVAYRALEQLITVVLECTIDDGQRAAPAATLQGMKSGADNARAIPLREPEIRVTTDPAVSASARRWTARRRWSARSALAVRRSRAIPAPTVPGTRAGRGPAAARR